MYPKEPFSACLTALLLNPVWHRSHIVCLYQLLGVLQRFTWWTNLFCIYTRRSTRYTRQVQHWCAQKRFFSHGTKVEVAPSGEKDTKAGVFKWIFRQQKIHFCSSFYLNKMYFLRVAVHIYFLALSFLTMPDSLIS